jgi:phosphatidylserine decarboxylase
MISVPHIAAGLFLAVFLLIPLVVKWELDKMIALPAVLVIGILAGLAVAPLALPLLGALFLEGLLVVLMAASLFLWRFFRDPERSCTPPECSVLSAADGRVIYIKKIDSRQVPVSEKNGRLFSLDEFVGTEALGSSGYLIGTAMTYLDVHVNRAPIAGKVRLLKHIGGLFDSLKHPESIFQNERVATVIETSGMTIGVVQIASRMVRNIIPFIREGEVVRQGQRIGKIRFGSQVDLILPDTPGLRIFVAPGDKLKAGLSVIARY